MKKSQIFTINIITIISLNICFLVCNFYPKHVLENYFAISIWDIVFNAIFCFINIAFMLVVFSRNKCFFALDSFRLKWMPDKKQIIIKFFVLVALQVIFDILLLQIQKFSLKLKFYYIDIFVVLWWIIAYFIIADKNVAIWKNKKRLILFSALLVLFIGVSAFINVYMINNLNVVSAKYLDSSPYLLRVSANFDYLNNLKIVALDSAIACTFIVLHGSNVKPQKTKKHERAKEALRTFYCVDLFVGLILIFLFAKCVISPQTVFFYDDDSSGGGTYSGQEELDSDQNAVLVRNNEREYSLDNVKYYRQNIQIGKNNETVMFSRNKCEPNFFFGADYQTSEFSRFYINNMYFFVSANRIGCYFEEETLRIIWLEDMPTLEKDDFLIEVFEKLLSDGNVFAFEYGWEYLLKYDREFIEPYIERYSQGDFTWNEKMWLENSYYRSEYIVNMAKAIS